MKIVPQIRGTHSYAFRSGEWAIITGVELVTSTEWSGFRPCYKVVFPDGVTDSWVIYESGYGYEFCNFTLLEPGDLTFLYVNIGPEGASTVLRNNATGQVMEIPGGPIKVMEGGGACAQSESRSDTTGEPT